MHARGVLSVSGMTRSHSTPIANPWTTSFAKANASHITIIEILLASTLTEQMAATNGGFWRLTSQGRTSGGAPYIGGTNRTSRLLRSKHIGDGEMM